MPNRTSHSHPSSPLWPIGDNLWRHEFASGRTGSLYALLALLLADRRRAHLDHAWIYEREIANVRRQIEAELAVNRKAA